MTIICWKSIMKCYKLIKVSKDLLSLVLITLLFATMLEMLSMKYQVFLIRIETLLVILLLIQWVNHQVISWNYFSRKKFKNNLNNSIRIITRKKDLVKLLFLHHKEVVSKVILYQINSELNLMNSLQSLKNLNLDTLDVSNLTLNFLPQHLIHLMFVNNLDVQVCLKLLE